MVMGSMIGLRYSCKRIQLLSFGCKFSPLSTLFLQLNSELFASRGDQRSRLFIHSGKSSMEKATVDGMKVLHNSPGQEFFITLGNEKAVVQYTTLADGSVDLWHTEVPPVFRGQGVARLLVQAAMDHFANSCTPMVLTCTYIRKFATDFPQPHHQKFIIKGLL